MAKKLIKAKTKIQVKTKSKITLTNKEKKFFAEIAGIIQKARNFAYKAVNTVMIQTNWNIGRRIVEYDQEGKSRAAYGDYLIVNLSIYLTDILGEGFSEANLQNMRKFYLTYPEFPRRRLGNLENISWSHWCALIRIEDEAEREYYIAETGDQNWGVK